MNPQETQNANKMARYSMEQGMKDLKMIFVIGLGVMFGVILAQVLAGGKS